MTTTISWVRNIDGSQGDVWNPTVGCSKGCSYCYAAQLHNKRHLAGMKGYETPFYEARCMPDRLLAPLSRRKPTTWFVDSMGDLFDPAIPDGYILRVFEVMIKARWLGHRFMILTKRPDRAAEWYQRWADTSGESDEPRLVRGPDATRKAHPSPRGQMFASYLETMGEPPSGCAFPTFDWMDGMRWWGPDAMSAPHIWLGVSVTTQADADERIPLLLQVPARVRFLSCEPMLGAVDLDLLPVNSEPWMFCESQECGGQGDGIDCDKTPCGAWKAWKERSHIDWVIIGGESCSDVRYARPMEMTWAIDLLRQCREAGVPAFVKQLGTFQARAQGLNDKHGRDISEWPEELRVQEWPDV